MRYLIYLVFLLLIACNPGDEQVMDQAPLFQLMSPDLTGVDFINTVENTPDLNIFSYRNFYNGGGVATGDVNNDGLVDLFFTHNTAQNRLYINKGQFQFEDVTSHAGIGGSRSWSTGVVMIDINADSWLDIYVCNAGYVKGEDQQNELYINNQDGTFTEKAADYGLNEGGYTTHAAFFDYDLDGDLDVYILNNSFMPVNTLNYSNKRELRAEDWPVRDFLKGGGDKFLRNEGGKFEDVTDDAGIYSSLIGFGLGVTVGDVNADGWPDMYISNDFFERDYLYINQQDGTFNEEIKSWMQHLSLFSMGADMADINNDGHPEIFVTDMLPDSDERLKTTTAFESYSVYDLKQKRDFYHQYMQNTLQLNNGDNTFSEVAHYSGVAASDWSWGALMFDMDNDGFRDIYICNGIAQDVTDQDFIDFFANDIIQKMALTGEREDMQKILDSMPSTPILNKAFKNLGNLKFEEVSTSWGFGDASFSNGAAYADLDNDGDLDLVVNNLKTQASIYQNRSEQSHHHFLTVKLVGKGANTFAIGAKIALYIDDQVLTADVMPSRGFQSSGDYKVVIGLGTRTSPDSLVISWPGLLQTTIVQPPIDTALVVSIEQANAVISNPHRYANTLFEEVATQFASHEENTYADFYYEGLLVKKLSAEGPAVSIGDVNSDGLDDVFLGGANGQAAQLYLQLADGTYIAAEIPAVAAHLDFEDTVSRLFDCDNDGDLDLYVGSGGNEFPNGDRRLLDRLYLNDGLGHLALSDSAIPPNMQNTSVVLPFDIDDDGDLDLFAGSRNVTQDYGNDPQHYVYINDGQGQFSDDSKHHAEVLDVLGMLTDGYLADLDGDAITELILTEEWSAPHVLAIRDSRLTLRNSGLEHLSGWWYSVSGSDLDNDGDQDLVFGNLGENFYLKASETAPVKLWLADFDQNGTVENIVSRTVEGRDVPVVMKKELTEQLASLKKENIKHADYARRSMQELFSTQQLSRSRVKTATCFTSMIAWNNGDGQFEVTPLPTGTQLSCICGILCTDINGDGQVDLLLGGNDYGFLPQFSRQDASFGHTLLNRGNGKFELIANHESGFTANGQIRAIAPLTITDKRHVIVIRNAASPKIFKVNG